MNPDLETRELIIRFISGHLDHAQFIRESRCCTSYEVLHHIKVCRSAHTLKRKLLPFVVART